jgi:hypothetical protein
LAFEDSRDTQRKSGDAQIEKMIETATETSKKVRRPFNEV